MPCAASSASPRALPPAPPAGTRSPSDARRARADVQAPAPGSPAGGACRRASARRRRAASSRPPARRYPPPRPDSRNAASRIDSVRRRPARSPDASCAGGAAVARSPIGDRPPRPRSDTSRGRPGSRARPRSTSRPSIASGAEHQPRSSCAWGQRSESTSSMNIELARQTQLVDVHARPAAVTAYTARRRPRPAAASISVARRDVEAARAGWIAIQRSCRPGPATRASPARRFPAAPRAALRAGRATPYLLAAYALFPGKARGRRPSRWSRVPATARPHRRARARGRTGTARARLTPSVRANRPATSLERLRARSSRRCSPGCRARRRECRQHARAPRATDRGVGHVAGDGDRAAPELRGVPFESARRAAHERHARTAGQRARGRSQPDPARRAGDDGAAARPAAAHTVSGAPYGVCASRRNSSRVLASSRNDAAQGAA